MPGPVPGMTPDGGRAPRHAGACRGRQWTGRDDKPQFVRTIRIYSKTGLTQGNSRRYWAGGTGRHPEAASSCVSAPARKKDPGKADGRGVSCVWLARAGAIRRAIRAAAIRARPGAGAHARYARKRVPPQAGRRRQERSGTKRDGGTIWRVRMRNGAGLQTGAAERGLPGRPMQGSWLERSVALPSRPAGGAGEGFATLAGNRRGQGGNTPRNPASKGAFYARTGYRICASRMGNMAKHDIP